MPAQPHLLLASDDEAVHRFLTTVLTRAGYRVSVVRNGTAAVAALLSANSDYVLALLDGQIPPILGNQVLATLREAGCRVPVILASGSFIVGERPPDDPSVVFLAKPFRGEDLIREVKRLLGEAPMETAPG
jgi:DNA-binding response OmpR family regulator